MLIKEFENYLKTQDFTENTIKSYTKDVELFMRWYIDTTGQEFKPENLTEFDLVEYKSYLLRQNLKPSTVNRSIISLRKFVHFLLDRGLVRKDISTRLKQVKDTTRNLSPVVLDKKDIYKFRRTVHQFGKTRDIALVELLLNTGMRISEAINLKLEDIEISERKGKVKIWGKGRNYREVPLNSDARKYLSEYINKRPYSPTDYLFVTSTGKPLTRNTAYKIILKYAKLAGIDLHPHMLRHFFAQTLIDKGLNIYDVQQLLGHQRIETTLRYKKPNAKLQEEMVENLLE